MFSGEKRMELLVVPGISVRMSPEIAIVPAAAVRTAAAAGRVRGRRRRARSASRSSTT